MGGERDRDYCSVLLCITLLYSVRLVFPAVHAVPYSFKQFTFVWNCLREFCCID